MVTKWIVVAEWIFADDFWKVYQAAFCLKLLSNLVFCQILQQIYHFEEWREETTSVPGAKLIIDGNIRNRFILLRLTSSYHDTVTTLPSLISVLHGPRIGESIKFQHVGDLKGSQNTFFYSNTGYEWIIGSGQAYAWKLPQVWILTNGIEKKRIRSLSSDMPISSIGIEKNKFNS
jgi:hypothetical protein